MTFCMVTKVAMLCLVALPASAAQTTTWVSQATGSDGSLTPANPNTPYATISRALKLASDNPTTTYIIKVVDGDYTQAHETTFVGGGYPIDLTLAAGLTITGVDAGGDPPTPAEYPRIGGDVGQDATALFSLILTGEDNDVDSLEIRNLHFLGEDETSTDSPIAVEVRVEDGNTITDFIIQNSTFERPYFNGSGTPRATIHIEVRNGTIQPRGTGFVAGKTIFCSERGGMEIIAEAEDGQAAVTNFAVDRNVFKVSPSDAAEFGLRWLGEDPETEEGVTGDGYDGLSSVTGNTVLGRGLIGTGIVIESEEHTNFGQLCVIEENVVTGCGGDGIDLSVDGWGAGSSPELATTFVRNRLTYNGGSGLVLRWDEDADSDGEGYLVLLSEGNLFAKNDGYGIEFHGYGNSSSGSVSFRNETIAKNDLGGEGYLYLLIEDEWGLSSSPTHTNCIMYANNEYPGDGSQVIGLDAGLLAALLGAVTYCDWSGISISNGNIDADPDFVNATQGDFHLSTDSPCIDVGLNSAVEESIDIDEEGRRQDGDHVICEQEANRVVDMGYDEVPDPCGD